MLRRTNIEDRLTKQRNSSEVRVDQVIAEILDDVSKKDDLVMGEIALGHQSLKNDFNLDLLESDRIYHIDTIHKICIDYRLRFLHSSFFKGELPYEAILKIKALEKKHQITLQGFKIMAPSIMFKLENADDPLLFAPIGNGYYYLIHKWGNDLHPFRKLMMWPFKSFENLIVLILFTSLVLTFLVPTGLFSKQESIQEFVLVFFFMFKAVAAIVLFYGFALGKNFNTAIWDSKFYNA